MIDYPCPVVSVKLEPCPNSDQLSIVRIDDYQCVVRTADWKDGDLGVYIPPDSIVPDTEQFRFLGDSRRIKVKKMRGSTSMGLLIPAPNGAVLGEDCAERLGVVHYNPEMHSSFSTGGENISPPKIYAPKYDVENFRRYSNYFVDGEEVVATEKIHGCVTSGAMISMPDGSRRTIRDLVNSGYDGDVLGYDIPSGKVVTTKVKNVYRNGDGDQWLNIKYKRHGVGRGSHFGSLTCTPNHEIYRTSGQGVGEFVEAKRLAIGDTIRMIRSELSLTPLQEQVLIGKMLGDGSCSNLDYSASIRFGHKKEHEEYLVWTERALGDMCGSRLADRTSGYGTLMVASRTVSSMFIKNLFDDWFVHGHKEVPATVINKIGPIALAFWYMDDGNLAHSEDQEDRASFATNGFSEQSVDNLVLALAKFGIHAIKYDSSGWRLRLNADDAEKLFLTIAPYVPPVMQYKLPTRYRGHTGWMPEQAMAYKNICVDQKITEINLVSKNQQRYDLETGTHNYFANGTLIHNCNARFVCHKDVIHCGSHTSWKREDAKNLWWKALSNYDVLQSWLRHNQDFVVYAEVFGQVQNLKYGARPGEIFIAVFDIMHDNRWLDYDEARKLGQPLPWVPLVYRGPFDKGKMFDLAEGSSLIPGADHYREGIVIKPVVERTGHIGRVQLKLVSNTYLEKS